MATISIGGLATGLDTGSIVEQLVRLERRRSVDLLTVQQVEATDRRTALQTLGGKLATLLSAVDELRDHDSAIARKATSADASIVSATAGSGAARGSTEVTVTSLARSSIATSANAKASATSTVAAGSGSFAFRVGDGDLQSIAIDGATTLEGLAAAINELDADVVASVVNVGTTSAPDYRLRMAALATGSANEISIETDGTDLGVAVTQSASDAVLTVSGFATPITRESNTVSDLIPGVTLRLGKTGGPVSIDVDTDAAAVREKVEAVVSAFNDLVQFVQSSSEVSQEAGATDGAVTAGPLAFDSTVQSILDAVHASLSDPVDGLGGELSLLAEVGVTSTREGTLVLDAAKLEEALARDDRDVAELFGGSGSAGGVFDRVREYLGAATQAGGLLQTKTDSVASELSSLESRIATAEAQLAQFEANLRATFSHLEVLVSQLQTQGNSLIAALSRS